MNWAAIQEAVRLAVAAAVGLPDVEINPGFPVRRVEWANTNTSSGFKSGPLAFLTLRSPRGIGVDEARQDYNPTTKTVTTTQCGVRTFTVSVSLQNDSQRPGEETVGALASTLRTRLRRRSVLDALHAAGIALNSIDRTIDADYRDSDGRWSSSSVTDLHLSAAENDLDTTDAGDYVNEVLGDGQDDLAGRTFDIKGP